MRSSGATCEFNRGGVVVNVKDVKGVRPVLQRYMRATRTTLLWSASMSSWSSPSAPAVRSSAASTRSPLSRTRRSGEEFWANVEVGKTYTGVVKSLTSYGAFVDIGGVDGLCHISELSWNRIKHPLRSSPLATPSRGVCEKISTPRTTRSSGLQASAEDNPWEQLKNNYPIGKALSTSGRFSDQVWCFRPHPAGC